MHDQRIYPSHAAPAQRLPRSTRGFALEWGAQRIGLPAAWAIATGAASPQSAVTLCIIDSGVDAS